MGVLNVLVVKTSTTASITSPCSFATNEFTTGIEPKETTVIVDVWLLHVVDMHPLVCVETMCILFLAHNSAQMYYVHFSVITCTNHVLNYLFFSMIQWKIPRLPLCWLRKQWGCNQSSGCFSHNPLCLSLHCFPIKGILITGNSAGNRAGRWEVGLDKVEQTRLSKTPL